jgi:hypothetical protein
VPELEASGAGANAAVHIVRVLGDTGSSNSAKSGYWQTQEAGMSTSPNRKRALALSNILFALMLVAAGVVAYLYFVDGAFFQEGPPPPACEAGRNEFICVIYALRDQDLDRVEPGRYTASANQLTQPGQVIEINKLNAFLFIYPAASPAEAIAAREADAADLDPETLQITARISDRPLNEGQEIHIYQQSSYILIVVGGSDEELAKIEAAVQSLP